VACRQFSPNRDSAGQENDLRLESMHGKIALLAAPLYLSWLIGCGSPAAPQPPSLNLPTPVLNLSAVRVGNAVHLSWTMPTRTTDRVALVHPITVQVCRGLQAEPCTKVGTLLLAPGGPGTFTNDLPADLVQGPDRLLRYEVDLRNHAGKSAGPSNAAYSAAGASPPALLNLSARVHVNGVELSWQPAPEAENGERRSVVFRIERLRLTAPAVDPGPKSPMAAAPPPAKQTLVVHSPGEADSGHALDPSALFNQRYRYVLERVAMLTLSGHAVELEGQPSAAVEVATTDTFPPVVPEGLVAVADAGGGAIDLSWSPNVENDLAAYHLYRRDIHGSLAAEQVSSLNGETSFRDTSVQPGHSYAYSLSAVDQSGNESKRSPDVEETLPMPAKEPAHP
jgi:hypothetical protein